MAPDRAATWACTCRWSVVAVTATAAAPADDGPPLAAVRSDVVSCLRVGYRHHPSPGLSDTSPAIPRSTVRATVWQPSPIIGTPGGSSQHAHRTITASRGVTVAQPAGLPVLVAGRRLRAGDPGQFRFRSRRGRAYGVTMAKVAGGIEQARQPLEDPGVVVVLDTVRAAAGGPDGATVKRDRGMRPQGSGPWRLNEPGVSRSSPSASGRSRSARQRLHHPGALPPLGMAPSAPAVCAREEPGTAGV